MKSSWSALFLFLSSWASSYESIIDLPMQFYKGNIQAQTVDSFKTLHIAQQCQTDLVHQKRTSSSFYRKLAYEALQNCGHPAPEVVLITSDTSKQAVPIGSGLGMINGLIAVIINFNQNNPIARAPYGVIRIIMHHEAWHIVSQDYAAPLAKDKYYYQNSQKRENQADHKAIYFAQCTQCAHECVEYFIKRHAAQNNEPSLKKYARCTLQNLNQISSDRIEAILPDIATLSIHRKLEHPFDIERALRIYIDSRALGDVLCTWHKKTLNTSKK